MVRTVGSGARPGWAQDESDEAASESEEVVSDTEYTPSKKKRQAAKKKSSKSPKTPRGKISMSRTPASKRKLVEAESSDEDEFDDEPVQSKSKKKKAKPAAQNSKTQRASGRSKKSIKYNDDSAEDETEEEYIPVKNRGPASRSTGSSGKRGRKHEIEEIEISDSEDEEIDSRNKNSTRKTPNSKKRGNIRLTTTSRKSKEAPEDLPPVSEMVVECIKALKDPPKKGSTLRMIKETIALNWPVNMRIYDAKIKKYITKALESGHIIQTKGKGFSGRFTVPSMKIKRKKKRRSLSAKFDEDEVEYEPKKTARDEEREKDQEELERRRLERALFEERKRAELAEERAKRPKKPAVKRDTFEVEAIRGKKEDADGNILYLVKFKGYQKSSWEPEANVVGCQELVEAFEKREAELAEMRRKAEQEGIWEVQRIEEVRFKPDQKRVFLIHWKGFGADHDSWEPEENLSCPELIEAFMRRWEVVQEAESKSLRVAPKKVQRLQFASSFSSRISKRNQGFRVTYEGMDE